MQDEIDVVVHRHWRSEKNSKEFSRSNLFTVAYWQRQ